MFRNLLFAVFAGFFPTILCIEIESLETCPNAHSRELISDSHCSVKTEVV